MVAVFDRQSVDGIRRFSHEAMATVFEVYGVHADARYAAQAAQAAFDLVDRLERELSRFLPNSDVARVNRLNPGESTRVSASTLECLVIARHMFDLTGGAFDVSIGTGLPSLELDADDCRVVATARGVAIDLGGIGKGYAVDLMAELLDDWELGQALIHGGFSSLLALDPPAGDDGWPLTLSDPRQPSRVLERRSAHQMAFGASGLQKGAHIVDPRSGEPAGAQIAAWVAVPRQHMVGPGVQADQVHRIAAAAVSDALATAFMLLSPDEIRAVCAGSPAIEAWILPGAVCGTTDDATEILYFGESAEPRTTT